MALQDYEIIGAGAAPSETESDDECGRAATCTVVGPSVPKTAC